MDFGIFNPFIVPRFLPPSLVLWLDQIMTSFNSCDFDPRTPGSLSLRPTPKSDLLILFVFKCLLVILNLSSFEFLRSAALSAWSISLQNILDFLNLATAWLRILSNISHSLKMTMHDSDKPYIPLAGLAEDGWSEGGRATATCYCGTVQLSFVSTSVPISILSY